MSFKIEFNATGTSQKLSLYRGIYKFECWGASGGDESPIQGASGAYVSGVLTITKHIDFFVYVGKKGVHGTNPSFNGGGRGSNYGASGGGATDIRLVDNQEIEGLKSRIIVAAGGGGANKHADKCKGGCGGILEGEQGYTTSLGYDVTAPTGGTQKSGGKNGSPTYTDASRNGSPGTFGTGGAAAANKGWGGGGGGGYFGGGGGADATKSTSSGAGGSSYISGYQGCLAINKSTTSVANPIMLNHPNHYSGIVFRRIEVKDGLVLQRNDEGFAAVTLLYNDICSIGRKNRKIDLSFSSLTLITVIIKN